jgi:ABC-type multidrug transport system fused ATPase/permease subunit
MIPLLLRKVLGLFSPSERRQIYLIFVGVTLMALVEIAGIASVMPFIAVLTNPEVINDNPLLSRAYDLLGFQSSDAFLFALGCAVLLVLIVRNAVTALTTWFQLRFAAGQHDSLARRLLTGYLHQPYEFFLTRNTTELSTNILSEIASFVNGMLLPGLQILAQSVVATFIVLMLLFVDPFLSLLSALALGGAYGLIFALTRRRLSRLGKDRLEANTERYRFASEALMGIKELKVLGAEDNFVDRFSGPSSRFARDSAAQLMVSQLPRFALETLAFGGMVGIALYLLATRGTVGEVLPLIGVYSLAAYRMLPALQQIFNSLTTFRFYRPSLDAISHSLAGAEPLGEEDVEHDEPISFETQLALERVTFSYPGTEETVLHEVNVVIPRGASVGFVGRTGSGKSTIIDLVVGLLRPQEGQVAVDGTPLDPLRMRSWQRMVGYVPQHIYLTDDSVAANIAFGVEDADIDPDRLRTAARIAQLESFIESLPEGFQTHIGEGGLRLSGGQRQRIGIARALYRDPPVLVLDEATSALDGQTERQILAALQGQKEDRTLLMVAHRLSTVEECDTIYVLENGRVEAAASYRELESSSAVFRSMLGEPA